MSRLHHRGSENDGRQGVEIDYCPECRGVWLDRGELDKNIECSYCQQVLQTGRAPAGVPCSPPGFL